MSPTLCHTFVTVAVIFLGGAGDASSVYRREAGTAVREAKGGGRDLSGASQTSRLLREDPSLGISYEAGDPESDSCADFDQSIFLEGQLCGAPLSSPCFDVGRCVSPPEGSGPTIYVYDYECSLVNSSDMSTVPEGTDDEHQNSAWRAAAEDAGVLAETYDSACAFIYVHPQKQRHPCVAKAPLWNDGANHLIVDYSDESRAKRPFMTESKAMEAAGHMHSCYYRSGFDMAVPLFPKVVYPHLAGIPPGDREFFLTVKGSIYLSGHGSEERMSVLRLDDAEHGVVASMHCFEMHDEQLLPNNVEYCQRLKDKYDDYSYGALMNTTFGLIPAGRSPASFRLGEVMSAGAIPVFVGRDLVRPFEESVDWEKFSFMFTPDEVGPFLMETLRSVPPEDLKIMQEKSLEAYWKMFGGMTKSFEVIARNIVDELVRRIRHHR